MRLNEPSWQPARPLGTYVWGTAAPSAYDPNDQYRFCSFRRVNHPSVARVLEEAVGAARYVCGNRQEQEPPALLTEAARTMPEVWRSRLAERTPEALTLFLRLAGTHLCPLQLIGDVPCLRIYALRVRGNLAERLYGKDRRSSPESTITDADLEDPVTDVRHLDFYYDANRPSWPAPPLVSVSSGHHRRGVFSEIHETGLDPMLGVLLGPGTRTLATTPVPRLVPVAEDHFDWAIATLMRAAYF